MDVMHSTLRDMEHFHTKLIQENDKLSKESEYSKVIVYLVQENIQLRATNQSLRDSTSFQPPDGGGGDSCLPDKSAFYRHLQASGGNASSRLEEEERLEPEPPESFHNFMRSMNAADDDGDETEPKAAAAAKPSSSSAAAAATAPPRATEQGRQPGRLLGEIAFQLDQRILSHIFQGQTRLYGFTVRNIEDKIADVAVHPVTGRQDEQYRRRLAGRRAALMERLSALGYRAALHPAFTEFVVNTYGIVEQRPRPLQEAGREAELFDNAGLLERAVAETAPAKLRKDLLVLLRCLVAMATEDGRPLFLW